MIPWLIRAIAWNYNEKQLKTIQPLVDKINILDQERMELSDTDIQNKTDELRQRLIDGETTDDILIDAFATVKQACRRLGGTETPFGTRNMVPYDVQLIGGIVLHQGRIGEMKTWEGKTLVATLPTYLNALTGKGVHVVTVNDYLASRDATWMSTLYNRLWLSVGIVTDKTPVDQRREQYEKDITYVQNSQLGFDYLRDNLVKSIDERKLLWRPLHFALIDEIDSILIDEARTPLIISEPDQSPTEKYKHYFSIVRSLVPAKGKKKVSKGFLHEMLNEATQDKKTTDDQNDQIGDYFIDEKTKTVSLSSEGIEKLEKMLNIENLYKELGYQEIHHIENALKAVAIYHKDKEYILRDGEVVIIDQHTWRAMSGRRFGDGLHQAIEAKEGVEIKKESKTLATITYQNFFKNYDKLSWMTGTALTEAEEFDSIYELEVIQIPTNKPVIRVDKNDKVMYDQNAKRKSIYDHISFYHEIGQPILIGTSNIQSSETVSRILKKHNIVHSVLNAKYHEQEASIVSRAGQLSSVVVATNMAWRGTDIKLAPDLNEKLASNYATWIQQQQQKGHWLLLYVYSDVEAQWTLDALVAQWIITADQIIEASKKKIDLGSYSIHITYNTKRKENTDAYMQISLQPHQDHETIQKDLHYGLFILATEKHESRRIDNQLRGRAWRQGDAGVSVFFVAFDDDIMRKMWWDKIKMVAWLMMKKDQLSTMEFTQSRFTNAITRAQKQMEGYLFGIRKHLFEYDSVIDKQRKNIYDMRDQMLFAMDKNKPLADITNNEHAEDKTEEQKEENGERDTKKETEQQITHKNNTDIDYHSDQIISQIKSFVDPVVEDFLQKHTILKTPQNEIIEILEKEFGLWLSPDHFSADHKNKDALAQHIVQHLLDQIDRVIETVQKADTNNNALSSLQKIFTQVYIRTIDKYWIEHIDAMKHTKDKVWLMGYAQQDPLISYKKEAYNAFIALQKNIKHQTLSTICLLSLHTQQQNTQTHNTARQQKVQSAAQNATPFVAPQSTVSPKTAWSHKKEIFDDGTEVFEVSDEKPNTKATIITPPKKKLKPNDKVSIKYKDGTIKVDVKYKKVQEDIANGSATIIT